MGFRINTNIDAVNAQRHLGVTGNLFSKSVERLSSGMRINRAGDDAAGLSISEKLRAQVNGMGQAARNAQDGISMIQTAEGALQEGHAMLQRMRELAVQASNDTQSGNDRAAINTELQQLRAEVDAISSRTKFNGKALLAGALSATLDATNTLKVGEVLATTTSVAVLDVDVSNALGDSGATRTYRMSYDAATNKLTLTDQTDTTRNQTLDVSDLGSGSTATFDFSLLGVKFKIGNESGANKVADDLGADLAAAGNRDVVLAAGSGAANLQIGASASDTLQVSFDKVDISALSLAASLDNFNGTQSVVNAQALITAVDSAIDTVNTKRANLGARQNRLEHTIANLNVAAENLAASESRIRDADVAAETVSLVKAQVLQQAGTAILAQANQAPQSVLSLLR